MNSIIFNLFFIFIKELSQGYKIIVSLLVLDMCANFEMNQTF